MTRYRHATSLRDDFPSDRTDARLPRHYWAVGAKLAIWRDTAHHSTRRFVYYGYIWSEVLDAATVDWFAEQAELDGGLRAAGERFRRSILEPGGSRDAMSLVSELLGGPAPIEPLLKRRGLQ